MKFLDLFPPPKFLTLSEAGISISEREVRFVSFKELAGGERRLEKSGAMNLPEGVVSLGALNDPSSLANILSRLRESQGFKYVSISIPEEKAYLFTTTVDKVPYKDLYDAVAFTIEEHAPVTLSKAVFAFEVLPHEEKVKAAVTVLPLEIVEAYAKAFELAGLTVVSVDTEPQAIARALVEKGDVRTNLIIHIGESKVGFCLVEDEVVQFSSTLSFDARSPDAGASLKAEIRKFFIFWNTKTDEAGGAARKIERVILSGGGAGDEALVSSVMADIETPYVLGNVWTNISSIDKHLPDMPFSASLSYASAIGSALGSGSHHYV